LEGSALFGVFLKEQVMFGNPADNEDSEENHRHNIEVPIELPVGCTTTETGMFITQAANGIMGLYAYSNSSDC
jgi:hypothetical protein